MLLINTCGKNASFLALNLAVHILTPTFKGLVYKYIRGPYELKVNCMSRCKINLNVYDKRVC